MIEISSTSNEHLKRWLEISTSRGIKKHGEFILMGEKLIQEFLSQPNLKIRAELICEDLKPQTTPLSQQLGYRVPVYKLSKNLFKDVDVIGTHWNLLVLECPQVDSLAESHQPKGLEVICPLGDPSNLGALARSALAFGASKIILSEESCNPFHPKAIKASAGALLKIPLVKIKKFREYITQNEKVYILDMTGESISTFKWPQHLQLAVGEEGPGVGNMKGLLRLKVPTQEIESLNANVAASIAMYSYSIKHLRN